MKKMFMCLLLATVGGSINAQVTAIPDASFERRLIDLGIDSDGVINGQVCTCDIENIRQLKIEDCFWMTDITGIQDFENLERLTVKQTMITAIDLSHNRKLRELNCGNNSLQALDVSNNTMLRELHIGNYSANDGPMNYIQEIDLSANSHINFFTAINMLEFKRLNLRNGNNNPNMKIIISYNPDIPVSGAANHVCIEVDNVQLARSGRAPYRYWDIDCNNISYSYTDNCLLDTAHFEKASVVMYPNPASDVVYITSPDVILDVEIYNLQGQLLKSNTINERDISTNVSALASGNYVVAVKTNKGTSAQKLIIK